MARTKQTARKSTGGKMPRMNLAVKKHRKQTAVDAYGFDSDLDELDDAPFENDQILLESFALASDRKEILSSLVEGSGAYYYYSVLVKVHQLIHLQESGKAINSEEIRKVSAKLDHLEQFEEYEKQVSSFDSCSTRPDYCGKTEQLKEQFHLLQLEQTTNAKSNDAISFWKEKFSISLNTKEADATSTTQGESKVPEALELSIPKLIEIFIQGNNGFCGFERYCSTFSRNELHERAIPEYLNQLINSSTLSITMKQRVFAIIEILQSSLDISRVPSIIECIECDLKGDWKSFFPFTLSSNDKAVLGEFEPIPFGDREIHQCLSSNQLHELGQTFPELLNNAAFVQESLQKIVPSFSEVKALQSSLSAHRKVTDSYENFIEKMIYADKALAFLSSCATADVHKNPDQNILIAKRKLLYHNLITHYRLKTVTTEHLVSYLEAASLSSNSRVGDSNIGRSLQRREIQQQFVPQMQQQMQQQFVPQMQQMQQQFIPQMQQMEEQVQQMRPRVNQTNKGKTPFYGLATNSSSAIELLYDYSEPREPAKKEQIKDILIYFFSQNNEETTPDTVVDPMAIISPFLDYFKKSYLLRLLAKVKLMTMAPNSSLWCKLMGKTSVALGKLTKLQILKFSNHGNPTYYRPVDKVSVSIQVKNISQLIVQVYEINVNYYFQQYNKPVQLESINLDGLVANYQETIDISAPAIQLINQEIQIPIISNSRAGIYVVEIVGGTKACRAMIRKGKLHVVQNSALQGHKLEIYDHGINVTDDCCVSLDKKLYTPSQDGLVIPYFDAIEGNRDLTENPTHRNCFALVTQKHGENHSAFIVPLRLLEMSFVLAAGMYIDDEQLFPGKEAHLLIRPRLFIKNTPCPLSQLKNITLTMTTRLYDNSNITEEFEDIVLSETAETVHSFKVPHNAKQIQFTLKADAQSDMNASVKEITARVARFTEVSDSIIFHVGIVPSHRALIFQPFLRRIDERNYVVSFLGRSGEPCPVKQTHVVIMNHAFFQTPLQFTLDTDEHGNLFLGALENIVSLRIKNNPHTWTINHDALHSLWLPKREISFDEHRAPRQSQSAAYHTIRALIGEQIELPFPFDLEDTDPWISLYRVNTFGDLRLDLCNDCIQLNRVHQSVSITLQEPGQYEFQWERLPKIQIEIVCPPLDKANVVKPSTPYFFTEDRELVELNNRKFLQISSITMDNNQIQVKLKNAGVHTRIHVIAKSFLSTRANVGEYVACLPFVNPRSIALTDPVCSYQTTRTISEEYRYILHRRAADPCYHGNSLPTPSLLVHPYPRQETTVEVSATPSDNQNAISQLQRRAKAIDVPLLVLSHAQNELSNAGHSCYAPFLSSSSVIIANNIPQRVEKNNEWDSIVTIPLSSDMTYKTDFYVCAVSHDDVVSRHFHRTLETVEAFKDLSLSESQSFPDDQHLAEHSGVSLLHPSDQLELTQTETLQYKVFDSLRKVFYALDAKTNFKCLFNEYITWWPKLTWKEKKEHWDRDASHEINLFLFFKDTEFFSSVVRPSLDNKMEKEFIDLFLLQEDLSIFLQLDEFRKLNLVEQVLLAVAFPERRKHLLVYFKDLHRSAPCRSSHQKTKEFSLALHSTEASVSHGIEYRSDSSSRKRSRMSRGARLAKKACKSQNYEYDEYEDEEEDYDDYDDDVYDDLNPASCMLPKRKKTTSTMECGEKQYHDGTTGLQPAKGKLSVGKRIPFYIEVLNHLAKREGECAPSKIFEGFLSKNFMSTEGFTELMFVMSIMDLSFHSMDENDVLHAVGETNSGKVALRACSNCIVYHVDVRSIQSSESIQSDLLVTQVIREPNSSNASTNPEEYIEGKVYMGQLSLLNISTQPMDLLNVLFQIPSGSIPIMDTTKGTVSMTVSAAPKETHTISYYFYFKKSGTYRQYPPHISQNGQLVAIADVPRQFKVVSKQKSKVDALSWSDVSVRGSDREFLDFIENPKTISSSLTFADPAVGQRFKKLEFFKQVTNSLRNRFVFSPDVWKFSFFHGEARTMGEYISNAMTQPIPFTCPRLGLIPRKNTGTYNHLEYAPLIHSRVHSTTMTNTNLKEQYTRFLTKLTFRYRITDEDILEAIYYLILQNRASDAYSLFLKRFEKLSNPPSSTITTHIQYDYIRAYLDFQFSREQQKDAFSVAKEICRTYQEKESIPKEWKERFEAITRIMNEYNQIHQEANNPTSQTSRLDFSSKVKESKLNVLSVENDQVILEHQNITGLVVLNLYIMDVEATFSFEPFADMNSSRCCFIQPSYTLQIDLPESGNDMKTHSIPIPEDYVNAQVMLEFRVDSPSICVTVPHFCSRMRAKYDEQNGIVHVVALDNEKLPLPGVYVKVFASVQDDAIFYKDGYTDLLGQFDYLNTGDRFRGTIKQLAILLTSESFGSLIHILSSPAIRPSTQDARIVRGQTY